MNNTYIQKAIQHNRQYLIAKAKQPVVMSDATAKLVGEGWRHMRNMPQEELDKLQTLSVKEIATKWDAQGEGANTEKVRAAIATTFTTMENFHKAIMGVPAVNKEFHDGLRNEMAGTAIVDTGLITGNQAGIDGGWTVAFTPQDLQNFESMKVMDIVNAFAFEEMRSSTELPDAESLGTILTEKVGPRFFASAFNFGQRDFRFSYVTVNNILTGMRQAYLRQIERLAYRKIGEFQSGVTPTYTTSTDTFSGTTYLDDIMRGREALNNAHFGMVNNASQIQTGKRKNTSLERPLPVSAQDNFIFYYNHKHFQFVEELQQRVRGEDGINRVILRNFSFVPTSLLPIGGAHTVTGEATDTTRDIHGFFGSTKDAFTDVIGGMAIIPGYRNFYGNFRGLTFLSQQEANRELTSLAAKFEANMVIDNRQKAHITLK